MTEKTRCAWASSDDSLYRDYHDKEWGLPIHDDRLLFEFLILEGFQAGLSWRTILYKRDNFRLAFDNFDPIKVAAYDEDKIAELLGNAGIIRNRLKIHSAVTNAQEHFRMLSEKLYGKDRPGTKQEIEQIEKEQQEVLNRMTELHSKLPAEYERHGWVWLFLRKKI